MTTASEVPVKADMIHCLLICYLFIFCLLLIKLLLIKPSLMTIQINGATLDCDADFSTFIGETLFVHPSDV